MEPQNTDTVLEIIRKVKQSYPQKDVWCYTGYEYEKDLLAREAAGDRNMTELLELIDVLVDGEFIEEKKNLRLAFRGSENQRLIDLKKTRLAGQVVCLE